MGIKAGIEGLEIGSFASLHHRSGRIFMKTEILTIYAYVKKSILASFILGWVGASFAT